MPLDVLVAGLIPPLDATPEMRGLRLPFLEKWLARGDVTRSDVRSARQWLTSAYALAEPAPIAPLSLLGDGDAADGTWVRADPVHVRIDRERTSLHAASALAIERAEADALVTALQEHFAADGFEFRAPTPQRWYVRVPAAELPANIALDEALARDAQRIFPAGTGRIKWPAALTEIQMVLGTHEVNTAREAKRLPPINSVWLWGGGVLPRGVAAPYASVHAEDAFARGLGTASGARVAPAPTRLADLSAASPAEWTLAMGGAPQEALDRGSAEEWISTVASLDHAWFEALGDTLASFGTLRVVLPSSTGTTVATLTSAARWRLLRGRKPLSTYA
jgi:hypothetical protein